MAKIKGLDKAVKQLNSFPSELDKLVKSTILKYAKLILNDAMSKLPAGASSIRSSYHIEVLDNGYTVKIYTDDELAAYIEFGTGDFASTYLSSQPKEVSEQAIKFFVSGDGTMPARPYLFPSYYSHKEAILAEINKGVNDLARRFNNA